MEVDGGYERKTGGKVLAIPHNGNLSNGLMFDDVDAHHQEADRPRLCRTAAAVGADLRSHADEGRRRSASGPLAERRVRELRDSGTRAASAAAEDDGHAASRVRARSIEARSRVRSQAWRQPVQVRHGRLDRFPHLAVHRRGEQLLRQGRAARAVAPIRSASTRSSPGVMAPQSAPDACAQDERIGPRGGLGTRKHARGALGRDGAQGGLRHDRHALLVRVFAGFDFVGGRSERSDFAENGYAHGVPMGGDLTAAPDGKAPRC